MSRTPSLESNEQEILQILQSNTANDYEKDCINNYCKLIISQPQQLRQNFSVIRNIVIWSNKLRFVEVCEELSYFLFSNGYILGLKTIVSSYLSSTKKSLLSTEIQTVDSIINRLIPLQVISLSRNELIIIKRVNLLLQRFENKKPSVLGLNKETNILEWHALPRNFSFIPLRAYANCSMHTLSHVNELDQLICGCAYPSNKSQLIALSCSGVRHIITVHESAFSRELVETAALQNIKLHHFYLLDRTPPTIEQLQEMIIIIQDAVESNEGIAIHCQGGVGRTNTVIIGYLMKISSDSQLSASDAINIITSVRKIILSQSQLSFLKEWWVNINTVNREKDIDSFDNTDNINTQLTPATNLYHNIDYYRVAAQINLPPLIMMCGFAASGKSTFSTACVNHSPTYFSRINKDEMRKKGQCQSILFDKLNDILHNDVKGSIIIDCCNLTIEKRIEWMNMSHRVRCWCIFFDLSSEECKYRIRHRENHPTIPSGEAGITVINSMIKQLQPPSLDEGFERIIHIDAEDQVQDLLQSWHIPFIPPEQSIRLVHNNVNMEMEKLIKFPRTPHILNLGGATRDDKVLGIQEINAIIERRQHVVIEEKVDGANIGFFIDINTNKIIAQNRSHYISSGYHAQFSPLDKWIMQHMDELWGILEPGRHILYGEWLYATHSVYYDQLPNWFIAYDLYDKIENKFFSRQKLSERLMGTSINIVPVLYEGELHSIEQCKDFLKDMSLFSSKCLREGIVLRIYNSIDNNNDEEHLVSRMKLVRGDFISGNERWNRSAKLAVNKLAVI
eukprot:gene4429-6264_t